jgi:hypothetical protein
MSPIRETQGTSLNGSSKGKGRQREAGRAAASPLKRKAEKLKACRAASPRRNEGVTGNENPGCLSSSSSEIEYEDDDEDEDEPSRQLKAESAKPAAR